MNIRKLIRESIESEFNEILFLSDFLKKVSSFSNAEEVLNEIKIATFGYLAPFNPIEPLRSAFREKILEVLKTDKNLTPEQKSVLERCLKNLTGERIQFDGPPPGAMM